MTRVNTTVLNTGSLLKDFRCSQAHIHKVIMWDDTLISLTEVIISLCISNYQAVYLKHIQLLLKLCEWFLFGISPYQETMTSQRA